MAHITVDYGTWKDEDAINRVKLERVLPTLQPRIKLHVRGSSVESRFDLPHDYRAVAAFWLLVKAIVADANSHKRQLKSNTAEELWDKYNAAVDSTAEEIATCVPSEVHSLLKSYDDPTPAPTGIQGAFQGIAQMVIQKAKGKGGNWDD